MTSWHATKQRTNKPHIQAQQIQGQTNHIKNKLNIHHMPVEPSINKRQVFNTKK
jgi:hypothetical protein